MLLDAGVSSTKITDEDYDDPRDEFIPYNNEHFDNHNNVVDDFLDNTYNETRLNCNDDESKFLIDDILQEMRLHSPIKDDFLNDLLSDDQPSNLFSQNEIDELNVIGNDDLNVNGNDDLNVNGNSYNNNFNENFDFQEHNADAITSNNILDRLLTDVTCRSPDVQMELTDGLKFQYDVMDQFNDEPDITLSFPEPDSGTTFAIEGSSGLNLDFETFNEDDPNNEDNYNGKPVLNELNTDSDNLYYPCSTKLPMTVEELQEDIQQYLNTEQDYSYASFDEYADMINATSDAQRDNTKNFPNNGELLQEYINDQNQLMHHPAPTHTTQAKKPANVFECTTCRYFTNTYHGIRVHKRSHQRDPQSRCTKCNFVTAKPYDLKKHQAYSHGSAYCCQFCSFVTHSKAKIRSHMLNEH